MAGRIIIDGIQPDNTDINPMFKATATNHVRIGAFAITNSTETPANCEIYICGDKGRATPSNATKILTTENISQNETLCPPELINQLIPAGGTLYIKVSEPNCLTFRVCGVDT